MAGSHHEQAVAAFFAAVRATRPAEYAAVCERYPLSSEYIERQHELLSPNMDASTYGLRAYTHKAWVARPTTVRHRRVCGGVQTSHDNDASTLPHTL